MEEKKEFILDLSLKYEWYDMIESGEKTEEYREIKDFYMNRLCQNYISGFCGFFFTPKEYDAVRFHRGQGSKQTMLLEFKGLTVGFGKPEWGAPKDKEVFIIKLGKRIYNKIEQRGHGFVPSSQKEICPTITGATFNYNNTLNNGYRIRKLTPRECFRLMGVSDADIDKIQAAGISKSQQYKMAGNSIVVNCLAAIFRQLFIGNFNKVQQTEIF